MDIQGEEDESYNAKADVMRGNAFAGIDDKGGRGVNTNVGVLLSELLVEAKTIILK